MNAFINALSMHWSLHHQCIVHRAIHHQCIHCIKCINFVHSVLPFIISASSVHLSMHHQCIHQCIHHCIIKAIHQCIINASLIHYQCLHQRIINPLSVHLSMHHKCNHQCIKWSIYHQCIIIASNASISFTQFFPSFIKFIQISSFALLFVHSLRCLLSLLPPFFFPF